MREAHPRELPTLFGNQKPTEDSEARVGIEPTHKGFAVLAVYLTY